MNVLVKIENNLNGFGVGSVTAGYAEIAQGAVAHIESKRIWGRIAGIDSSLIKISGLQGLVRIGDRLDIENYGKLAGEVIAINDRYVLAMPSISLTGIPVGARVFIRSDDGVRPCDAWLGNVLNSEGKSLDGTPVAQGAVQKSLTASPIAAAKRRGLGPRINTGLAALDTFLPLCRGQRVGLFAGSGIGKSSLLADLANGVEADVVVLALVGERSREVHEFVEDTLGSKGRARSVVIACTCDEPASSKRRAALLAMTTAEYFRDKGLHVLVLFDSISRFADAHREIALTAGETPSLRAYPPSTFRAIAELAERTGPGSGRAGDITAVFSVLVAGSDMDEPVADMVRSILDAHIVLERSIAERGRFPAIDVRRSVSRSLPKAAGPTENRLLTEARSLIGAYEDAATMIQTGLYAAGSDPMIDQAIKIWPELDAFVAQKSANCTESYSKLESILRSIK